MTDVGRLPATGKHAMCREWAYLEFRTRTDTELLYWRQDLRGRIENCRNASSRNAASSRSRA
jgi:hypothetical protein